MAIVYALFSAFFAGLMTLLLKYVMMKEEVNPLFATLVRTIIVFAVSLLWTFCTTKLSLKAPICYHIMLWLSALSMAGCWIFYFKSLEGGSATVVGTFDKASTILTILLSVIFLNEKLTIFKIVATFFLIIGTIAMSHGKLEKKSTIYCILMLIFASLMSIFSKLSATYEVDAILSLTYRMAIVFGVTLVAYLFQKQKQTSKVSKKGYLFLTFASFTTLFSWFFYFKALSLGEASIVIPINKLSLVLIAVGSIFVFHEKLNKKNKFGLFCMVFASILLMFGNR